MDIDQFVRRVGAMERRLYRTARCLLPSDADCEDAVQETLFRAWRRILTLREEEYFETWLTRILINECKSTLRKRARRAEVALPDSADVGAPEEEERLAAALGRLDARYRLPLVLRYADGYGVDEVARMLRLPRGAVRWRVQRGKKLLGEILEGDAMS